MQVQVSLEVAEIFLAYLLKHMFFLQVKLEHVGKCDPNWLVQAQGVWDYSTAVDMDDSGLWWEYL